MSAIIDRLKESRQADIESGRFAITDEMRQAREQERADAQAQAEAEEAEANKSWLDRAEDAVSNTAEWVYNGVTSEAEQAVENAKTMADYISSGYQHASEGWNRLMDTEANITEAFNQENVEQANETGDYSTQEEAVAQAQEDAAAYREGLSDFAGSFTRLGRQRLGSSIDEAAEEGSEYAQDFRATETFLDYFQSDAKKLERAKAIEEMTGIPQASFLNDETAYKEALKVYDETKKEKDVLGDDFTMDAVWQKYPELADVANMSPQDAAMALHHMDEVRSTHGIVESFQVMLEVGNKQLEYSNLQFKIGNGTATDADKERAEELKQELMNQQKELPSFFDEPLAAMVGGVAGSTPMMYHAAQEAGQDAAAWWLAGTIAGAGVGSIVGPLGTATGAAAGARAGSVIGLARFGWLFVQNLSRMQKAGNAAAQIAKVSAKTGMVVDLEKQMVGQSYGELGELKDKNGNQLLDDKARWKYALAQGTAEMALEMAPLGVAKNALVGRPYARKMVGDILASAQARAGAVESMKTFARDRGLDVLKVAGAEAGEEGLQSVSDDIVHNQIAADTGDSSIGVYTWKDMAVRGLQASTEALPASLGFGLLSGFGGTMTGGLGRAAALRHQAAFEARYGKEAQQTMLGTAMFERIQNVLKNGKLKQDAPDVQRKVLRSQLAGTGYETVYIDTETAMEKENGAKDLQAVAKEAGLSDEELQQAIDQKGTITVAGEQFLQADSSPELLESVSFQPEAESMARMKKGAEQTLKAVQEQNERIIRQQEELQKGILDTYAPEDGTQEGTRKRQALTAILMLNPENPAEGWRQAHKEYRARLDDILAPALDALKAGMGRGGQIMDVKDEIGNDKTIRFTENSPWYQKFYAMNKRAPTAAELEDMAVALTTGDVNAPKVEGWVVTSKEQQDAMAQAKPEIEALQQRLADLDAIKGTARSLNGIEMELTQGLSKEGFQVYKALTRDIAKSPTRAARAARMSAIIFARHADLFAKKWAEKMGAKYTAKDYYAQRFGIDLEGKYKPGRAGFAQPVTEVDLALNKQIPVVDLDAMDNSLRGKSPKKVLAYVKENLPKELIPTADFKAEVGIPEEGYGKKHLVRANSTRSARAREARNASLANLKAVIGNSYLVEVVPNEKIAVTEGMSRTKRHAQNRKNRIDEFYRFIVPVRLGGKLKTLVLVAENVHGNVKMDEGKTSLYEILATETESRSFRQPAQDASGSSVTQNGSPSTISIRDALRGVKDFLQQPYLDENGNANYGVYLKNGVMFFDEEQAEQYQQMAWHGSPHTFDTFDLGAIGTGEGTQAHGWGLYFAKDRKISKTYHDLLTPIEGVKIGKHIYKNDDLFGMYYSDENGNTATESMVFAIESMMREGRKEEAISFLRQKEESSKDRDYADTCKSAIEILKENDSHLEQGGMLARVEIPEDDVMLDEQKPFDEQPYGVRKSLKEMKADTSGNGRDIYVSLALKLGSPSSASVALNDAGIKGIKYHGERDGDCYVVFDDKAVSIIEQYNQQMNGGGRVNRGAITPLSDGRRIVSLFEDADESTFVHEMGHLFLMDLEDLARVDDVSAKELQIVDDWATWKKGAAKEYANTPWAREFNTREKNIIAAEEQGDFETADRLKRQWRQERFARAFELYLRDGKAPARGLRSVFRKFKSYLRVIYSAFTGDGGRASEGVRRVMDRMIATEDEIEAMKLDDRFRDVEAAGGEKLLTEDERDTYARWQKEAREHAKEELMHTVMKDLTEKKQQAFDARLKSERERRVRELQQEPAAIAMQAAQSSGSDEIVLNWYPSKEAFADAYDKWSEVWDRLDDDMAAYAKELDAELMQTYLSEEAAAKALESSEYHAKLEGLVATALAKKLGLVNKITSKAERAMMSIEDKLTALPEEVDLKLQKDSAPVKKLMKAINELRFSSRWSAADYREIERMVRAATKEDVQEALKELKAREREDKQNEKAVLEANQGRLAAYKRLAAERIQKMDLAEATNVRRFRQQEKQAARRVQQMIRAKHWEMAVHMQEQKAMAAELAKAAEKMQAEVQKKLDKVKKQLTARTVKLPRDERYWHRHLAYLLRMTNKDAEKPAPRQVKDADGKVVRTEEVQGLTELFKSMKDNLDVDTPPIDFLEKAAAAGENFRGWRSLTKAEFDDAVDALTMLYTTGRDKFRMKTIGGKDIAEVLDEIMNDTGDASYMKVNRDLINEDAGGLGYNGWLGRVPGLGQALARYGQEYLSVIMKPEEILRALGKTAHSYIYGIYEKAITREAERLETAVKDLRALRAGYTHKEVEGWQKKRWTLETSEGTTLISKENVLAMALNLGTRKNVQRLVDGFGMREEDVRKFVYEHMTEKDWTFVQSVWDYLSSYWPETVAVEEQLNGTTLKKEPAAAFDVKTEDGKIVHLKGGYYPIKYNPKKSIHAMNQEENRMAQSAMAGARVLGTGRDFTKGRAQYVARPLLLELHVIPDHVQEVIHNIEVRIPARDVYRLVYSKQMEDKVTSTMGADYYKILTEWATDVWKIVPTETNQATNKANRFLSFLRRNSVMAIMGYRLWPVIENASNIGPVMEKLGATHALGAVANFYSHFEANKDLLYKSVFMRNRINSMDRDISSQEGLFQADWRPFEIIRGHAYDMMLYSDLALSAPLWTQTYKDVFSRKLGEVRRENEARVKAVEDGVKRVDAAKAAIIDARTAAAEAQERQRAEAQRAAELADAAYTHVGAEDALFQNEEQAGGSPFDVKAQGENEVGAGAPDGAIAGTSDNATLSTASRSTFPKGEGLEDTAGGILDDTQEAPKSLKELQKELAEAEDAFAKAQEAEILDEDAVVKEAERRSVAEADAAIRDTFGSGRAMDLASIQRQKSEAMKLMTVFYSFFNTQFNAIFAAYRHGKYAGRTEGTIRRWAPFARSMIYRVVVMSLVGCLLKYALGIEGSDDKDKWKKVKNPETGKEEQQEVPPLERFLKVFGKNTLSQMAGSFVLVRDIVNLGINYAFDGTTYGRGINPMESSFRSFSEAGKAFDLLWRKGEKDLQIEEKHAKEAQEQAERLKKLKGKKRQEYLQKLEEDAKYKKPDERITYSEILRHAANAGVTLTATHTGLTSTLVDAITGTMQYLNDADGRYDSTWKQIFWSALFDKKPVEREIPKRPPAPPKKKKKQAK